VLDIGYSSSFLQTPTIPPLAWSWVHKIEIKAVRRHASLNLSFHPASGSDLSGHIWDFRFSNQPRSSHVRARQHQHANLGRVRWLHSIRRGSTARSILVPCEQFMAEIGIMKQL